MPAVMIRSWMSAIIAVTAILNSKRTETYRIVTTRNTTRASRARRETVPPHLEPIALVSTDGAPVACWMAALTLATSFWSRVSVWTRNRGGVSLVIWITWAAGPTTWRIWASVTGLTIW